MVVPLSTSIFVALMASNDPSIQDVLTVGAIMVSFVILPLMTRVVSMELITSEQFVRLALKTKRVFKSIETTVVASICIVPPMVMIEPPTESSLPLEMITLPGTANVILVAIRMVVSPLTTRESSGPNAGTSASLRQITYRPVVVHVLVVLSYTMARPPGISIISNSRHRTR